MQNERLAVATRGLPPRSARLPRVAPRNPQPYPAPSFRSVKNDIIESLTFTNAEELSHLIRIYISNHNSVRLHSHARLSLPMGHEAQTQ